MPACTAFGWKSRTRVASLEAPGSAPSPPQPATPDETRTAASSATTRFIEAPRIAFGSMADSGDDLLAYVEIPKGSRNKYEYDQELGS